ncbi:MAG: helix-turn-helix domain-containing protein [Phycisphaerales bacterium]|nr:helix-turn-helix domain-containing protein [Phycisphaerales bacterium]
MPIKENHEFMTLAEAAEMLRLSSNTVYKLCRSGELPSKQIGRQWRIRAADLEAWLAQSHQDPKSRPATGADPLVELRREEEEEEGER